MDLLSQQKQKKRMKRANVLRLTVVVALGGMLVGCESENEHFCAKYQYFYRELTAPGILPIRDLREQLEKDLAKSPDSDRTKMALFVLDDIEADIKPKAEEPREYCMRRQRWTRYR